MQQRTLSQQGHLNQAQVSLRHVRQDNRVFTNAHSILRIVLRVCPAIIAQVLAVLLLLSLAPKATSVHHLIHLVATQITEWLIPQLTFQPL